MQKQKPVAQLNVNAKQTSVRVCVRVCTCGHLELGDRVYSSGLLHVSLELREVERKAQTHLKVCVAWVPAASGWCIQIQYLPFTAHFSNTPGFHLRIIKREKKTSREKREGGGALQLQCFRNLRRFVVKHTITCDIRCLTTSRRITVSRVRV